MAHSEAICTEGDGGDNTCDLVTSAQFTDGGDITGHTRQGFEKKSLYK